MQATKTNTLRVHEPPIFELLPDRDHWRTVRFSPVEVRPIMDAGGADV
jgi:hypothetical protein